MVKYILLLHLHFTFPSLCASTSRETFFASPDRDCRTRLFVHPRIHFSSWPGVGSVPPQASIEKLAWTRLLFPLLVIQQDMRKQNVLCILFMCVSIGIYPCIAHFF